MHKEIRIDGNLKEIATPLVCENRDDFTKYMFSLASVFSNPDHQDKYNRQENMEFTIEGLRMMCHEYLALVFSGKLQPYDIRFQSEEDKRESIKSFRSGMLAITERLMKSGVPMHENNGRYEIEFDDLKEMGKKEFEDGES